MVRLYELSLKLKMNEFYNTNGISLNYPEDESYSDEVIEKAKLVKAKHIEEKKKAAEKGVQLDLYSDSWYLEFAKSLKKQYLVGRSKEIYDKSIIDCPVKDPQWAIYSYDEILEMENSGVEIPEEVRQWAHAQQQADVTDYIMISEETTTEDTSASTEDSTNNNDLNSLQKKTKQYIVQSENAQEEIEVEYNEHQKKANSAKKIKKQKEDSYKDSMNELSDKTKEWQKLNEKKKQGHLSFKERIRFKHLSKILDTSNGTLLKEVQADQNNLEDFLESLDGLNAKTDESITLAQETVKAGTDLAEYGKTYNNETHETTGSVNNGMGLSSETLYDVNTSDLAKIAVDTGKDLEAYADTIVSDLTSAENVELNDFAQDYSELAGATLEKVNQKDGTNEEDEENADKKENEFNGYTVSKSFSYQNSVIASAITTKAMVELLGYQPDLLATNKQAKKDIKKAEKEIKTLTKETEKTAKDHESNIRQEEEIMVELEELDSENTQDEENVQVPTNENTTEDEKAEVTKTDKTEKTEEAENTDDTAGEKQSKIAEVEAIDAKDEQNMSKVKNIASKNAVSNEKYKKTAKLLNTQNNGLDKRSANLEKISDDTTLVGAGTFAKSFVTTALGNTLFATGQALMASLYTFSQGVRLVGIGLALIDQGIKESIFGTAAIVTGRIGAVVSDNADENVSDAAATNKALNATIKASNKTIKNSGAGVETQDDATGADGADENSSTQTETTEQPTEGIAAGKDEQAELPEENIVQEGVQADTGATEVEEIEETPETEGVEETEDKTTKENDTTTAAAKEPSKTEETEETSQNTKNEENSEETTNNNDNSGYNVSLGFNAPNSIQATKITNQATANMLLASRGVDKSASAVIQQTKKSKDLEKTIDKEAQKAKVEQENNGKQTQNIVEEITMAQAELQNASSYEEAQAAQDKVVMLSSELDSTNSDDAQTGMDKSVANGLKQLLQFKKDTQALGADNTSLNSIIANQLNVSSKTLAIGIGTEAFGVKDTIYGSNKLSFGISLMASPFTYSAGLALTIDGGIQLANGILEISTGTVAAATGIAGISSNSTAKETSQDAAAAKKEAEAKYKDVSKNIDANVELVEENDETQADTEVPTEEEPELPPQEEEEVDETALANSATANVNIAATSETDDKADKKLTRFNTDSIIESKKKQKKVQAIKASSKN